MEFSAYILVFIAFQVLSVEASSDNSTLNSSISGEFNESIKLPLFDPTGRGARRFNKALVTWRIERSPSYLQRALVRETIVKAFDAWSSVAVIDFREDAEDAVSHDVDIVFDFLLNRTDILCEEVMGPELFAHCARSNLSLPVWIHYNGNKTFVLGEAEGSSEEGNLLSVTMHEIGHALGLNHIHDSEAIMYRYRTRFIRTLAPIDIEIVQDLYGVRGRRVVADENKPKLCQPGGFYCGRELIEMGYVRALRRALYECDAIGARAIFHNACPNGCGATGEPSSSVCHCQVGARYCGHELRQLHNWDFEALLDDQIYTCRRYNRIDSGTICEYGCTSNTYTDSMCRNTLPSANCTFGHSYCGYELRNLGYKNVNPRVLYRCGIQSEVRPAKECDGGCVTWPQSRCSTRAVAIHHTVLYEDSGSDLQ